MRSWSSCSPVRSTIRRSSCVGKDFFRFMDFVWREQDHRMQQKLGSHIRYWVILVSAIEHDVYSSSCDGWQSTAGRPLLGPTPTFTMSRQAPTVVESDCTRHNPHQELALQGAAPSGSVNPAQKSKHLEPPWTFSEFQNLLATPWASVRDTL